MSNNIVLDFGYDERREVTISIHIRREGRKIKKVGMGQGYVTCDVSWLEVCRTSSYFTLHFLFYFIPSCISPLEENS